MFNAPRYGQIFAGREPAPLQAGLLRISNYH
jgi:hypothetical protein